MHVRGSHKDPPRGYLKILKLEVDWIVSPLWQVGTSFGYAVVEPGPVVFVAIGALGLWLFTTSAKTVPTKSARPAVFWLLREKFSLDWMDDVAGESKEWVNY